MSRLRILHLGKYYPPVKGGIETVVETLCRGEAAWADSSALVINDGPRTVVERRDGVEVTRVGSPARVGAVSLAPALPVWLARADADVLVLHEPNPMALVAYFLARPQMPLVVWYHSEVIRSAWKYKLLYEPLLEFALRRAARIAVASPQMRDVSALARHRDRCVVVPFGLDVDRYHRDQASALRIEAMSATTGRPTFLFVGRLVGYKGVDVLLKALQGLEANAVIIGDGPLRDSLESMARDLDVADRVRFLGEVSDNEVLEWYHACDAFVLPSVTRQEAFGMVQLEAMLHGRPVISTELGTGVSWVNQHERTGLVVRPGDTGDLRRAMQRLIDDRDLRERYGAAGRARVLNQFTAEKMCSVTSTLYQAISGQASSSTQAEPAAVA